MDHRPARANANIRNLSLGMGARGLAEFLFASPLQESDNPSPRQVLAAVEDSLAACGGDCIVCAAGLAQAAGDDPEAYASRMLWALRTVENVFPGDAGSAT